MSYVVLAELRARDGQAAQLEALLDQHAIKSQAEPGCLIFNVQQPPDSRETFVLYELYCDAEAYRSHQRTDHYQLFLQRAATLVSAPAGRLLTRRQELTLRKPENQ